MGRGRIKAAPNDPENSIASRIRTAMVTCGLRSVAELGRRIGLPRQTVHRWINGDTRNMTHENLYKVADALQVRARWLALGDTASTPIELDDGDVLGLIKTYEAMPPAARDQWLAIGRTLLTMQAGGPATAVETQTEYRAPKPDKSAMPCGQEA